MVATHIETAEGPPKAERAFPPAESALLATLLTTAAVRTARRSSESKATPTA